MENSLMKQLEGVVSNNKLLEVGDLRIKLFSSSISSRFYLHALATPGSVISIENGPVGAQFYKWTGVLEPLGSSFTLDESGYMYALDAGNYTIKISNKYTITTLSGGSSITVDLDDLYGDSMIELSVVAYGTIEHLSSTLQIMVLSTLPENKGSICGDISKLPSSLQRIVIPSERIYGDIGCFSGRTGITQLVLQNCPKVNGTVTSILGCTGISNLQIPGTSVTGSLSQFISNGNKVLPNLSVLDISNTRISHTQEDIDTLRILGVSVYV